MCENDTTSWVKALPIAEFAHNQRTHEARHMSPFKLMYGTDPIAIPIAIPRTSAPAVDERLEEIKCFREEALAAHELNTKDGSKDYSQKQTIQIKRKGLAIGKEPIRKRTLQEVRPKEGWTFRD